MESAFSEISAAISTGEALGMIGLVQGRDAFVQDGLVATSASRREQLLIVDLAVRLPIAFKEALRSELLVAMSAYEMLDKK